MAVLVPGRSVIGIKIPADGVIDITVHIIVDAIAGNFIFVDPDVVPGNIGVVPVDAAVDKGNDYRRKIIAGCRPGTILAFNKANAFNRPLVIVGLAPGAA